MNISKRALGFLCRQYKSILCQNRLANALGTCTLPALLCATVSASGIFVVPNSALAMNIGYAISDSVLDWTSDTNISGDILLDAQSPTKAEEYTGVYAAGSGSVAMTLQSGHAITVTATGKGDIGSLDIYGMSGNRDENTLTNAGSITLMLTADGMVLDMNLGVSDADAYGMYALGSKNTLINSGTITVTAASTYEGCDAEPFAYGMSVDQMSTGENVLINDGVIEIEVSSAFDKAWGRGMYALYNGSMTNNGTLTVHAVNTGTKAEAKGARAQGLCSMIGGTLVNNGIMTVTAQTTHGDAKAYGMCIYSDIPGTCTLNNYGTINVAATSTNGNASAYQAYLKSGSGSEVSGGTANVGTWSMKLGETYGEQANGSTYYVFGVGERATLNFGLDGKGANLIISDVVNGFESGVEYKISDMIHIEEGGIVTGSIDSIKASLPFLTFELVDAGTADDYTDQSIVGTLDVNSANSPVQGGANHTVAGVKGHMLNIGNVLDAHRGNSGMRHGQEAMSDTATMYADANTTVTDAGTSYTIPDSPLWQAFLMPFYSTTSDNGGAYDTNMGGLVLGASRLVSDDFVFGFHASLAKATSDSVYTDSDAMSYALGINGVYNVNESLYFSGQLTGFLAENNMDMVASAGPLLQKASASMDTYGMYAKLAAGYDIALTPQHVLTPELALSYLYAYMEGFDSAFVGGGSSTPFSMASEMYDSLYADASVRWTGTYNLGASESGYNFGILKPTLKAGIRQALTDPEVSSTMNIFGSSATTHADANETAFLCEAGLVWDMGAMSTSLVYSGEFGDAETSHMGMLKLEWKF